MPEVPAQFTPLQQALLEQYRELHGLETIEQAAEHAYRASLAAVMDAPTQMKPMQIIVKGRKQ